MSWFMSPQAQEESKALSKEILAPIRRYQEKQGPQGNKSHTLVILGALAFVIGVTIGRLRRKDYEEANEFFQENLKKIREELRP